MGLARPAGAQCSCSGVTSAMVPSMDWCALVICSRKSVIASMIGLLIPVWLSVAGVPPLPALCGYSPQISAGAAGFGLGSERVMHWPGRHLRGADAVALQRRGEARVQESLEPLRRLPYVHDAPAALDGAGGMIELPVHDLAVQPQVLDDCVVLVLGYARPFQQKCKSHR